MRARAIAATLAPDAWGGLRLAVPSVALGLLLLAIIFHAEMQAAVRVWLESTTYNHCVLIIPIAAYLAWDRRARLVGVMPHPVPWLALAGLPLGIAWLAAERLGIMEGRQLVAMMFVELLFLVVLGWRLFGRLSAPLLYLVFLVPFGSFVTPLLQRFTAWFVVSGLNLLGIPNFSDGNTIEIPEGAFYIAQACAGLRFLIASIAFGVLYACLIYRSPGRRVIFIGVAIVTPIVANGLRALGIVTLGHLLGSAQAAAADHVLYGWIFFSLVLLVLVVLGLPFREDHEAPRSAFVPASKAPASFKYLLAPAVAVALIAAIGPVTAEILDRSATARPIGLSIALDPGSGCNVGAGSAPATDIEEGSNRARSWHIACGPTAFTLYLEAFSPRTNPHLVLTTEQRLSVPEPTEDVETNWLAVPGMPPNMWQLVETSKPFQATAVTLWVNGTPAADNLATRLRLAWNTLAGATKAPVVMALHLNTDGQEGTAAQQAAARDAIAGFLRTQPSLIEVIRRAAKVR